MAGLSNSQWQLLVHNSLLFVVIISNLLLVSLTSNIAHRPHLEKYEKDIDNILCQMLPSKCAQTWSDKKIREKKND